MMTALEAYELATHGGATDFARLIRASEFFRSYCLIGGLAVNCYATESVYSLDVNLVVERQPHFLDRFTPESELRIQLTKDERYQAFLSRAVDADVLGVHVRIACLEDVTQGKLWAYSDPRRRLSKRKKDELDLIRLAEAHPELKSRYPSELREQLDRG